MSTDLSSILTDSVLRESAKRRLTKHTRINAETGCYEWAAATNEKGYAVIRVFRRPHGSSLASRVVWTLHHGAPPDGLVLHKCDNPRCVNVCHLFLGDQTANMADMKAKGRQRSLCGEASNFAKITEADVVQIRERYGAGEPPSAIGTDFGLTYTGVILIATGKAWKHVPGACPRRGYAKKTKMTADQLAEARRLHAAGWSYKRLGSRYGVAPGTVHRLATKKAEASPC